MTKHELLSLLEPFDDETLIVTSIEAVGGGRVELNLYELEYKPSAHEAYAYVVLRAAQ